MRIEFFLDQAEAIARRAEMLKEQAIEGLDTSEAQDLLRQASFSLLSNCEAFKQEQEKKRKEEEARQLVQEEAARLEEQTGRE